MMHVKRDGPYLSFEGDCDWTSLSDQTIIYQGQHYHYSQFQEDGWVLPIEELKIKWGIKDIQILGRTHCKAGYTDRLHPEKSWYGKNPAVVEKLKRYLEELEKEENGSESS